LDASAGTVQPDTRGSGLDTESRCGVGDVEAVNRDELEECTVAIGELRDRAVQGAQLALGVDALLDSREGVGVEQAACGDLAGRLPLGRLPSHLGRDDATGDAVQPGRGHAAFRLVRLRRVDRGEEHVAGQVRREVRVGHPPRDEPPDRRQVLTVERLERCRVGADRAC
jgi:hypothetical protein